MPYMPETREYRSMQIEAMPIDPQANQSRKVRGYFTTYDQPYYLKSDRKRTPGVIYEIWETVERGAFENCDMSDVIMQYDHQGRVFARMSNRTLDILPDDAIGKPMEAELGGTTIGRQLHEEITGGYTREMSFGFSIAEDSSEILEERENEDGTIWVKVLHRIKAVAKLFDVSAVSIPANPNTAIYSARSMCDGLIDTYEAERLHAAEIRKKRAKLALKIKLEVEP